MPSVPVRMVPWEYLNGETVTPGGVSAALNPPGNASIIEIRPEDEAVYYTLDGTAASAASPGFIAAGSGVVIGPLATRPLVVRVFMAGVNMVHVMYYKEHGPY